MSVPPETMEQQLLQGLFQQEPDNEDRLRALRRQSAIGTLATMGGANLAPMGQGMVRSAEAERRGMDTQRNKGLARSVAQIQGLKGLKDLTADPMAGQAQWATIADPRGGFLQYNKYTGETRPVEGYAPGGGVGGEDVDFNPNAPIPGFDLKEAQGKGFNLGLSAAQSFKEIEQLIEEGYSPGPIVNQMYKTGSSGLIGTPAALMSDERDQQFSVSGLKLADAILRYRTGAAAPEHEVRTYAIQVLPQYYESEAVQRKKIEDLKPVIRGMGAVGGPEPEAYLNKAFDYYLDKGWQRGQQQQGQQQTGDIIDLPPPR